MRRGNNTLPIDFNDAVPDTDASSLCYTAPHQTADLQWELDVLNVHNSWNGPQDYFFNVMLPRLRMNLTLKFKNKIQSTKVN